MLRRRLVALSRLLVLMPLMTAVGSVLAGGLDPTDESCVGDSGFPTDCVDRLGPIGDPPPVGAVDGYLGIASPIVNPLLRLEISDERNGRLYAVNTAGNTVRVLTPDGDRVLADIQVCYRPSALTQDPEGNRVFVSCHASNAVGIIDTAADLMVGVVQDRDEQGLSSLQEPMGLVFAGDHLYVASSQNHRIAVIDPSTEQVLRYIHIPGQDPRSLAVTEDGGFLIVANFLAGNRTEPAPPVAERSDQCDELLQDPSALAVFDENSPDFMDDSHPLYARIAECYFAEFLGGAFESVVRNPIRSDHDLVVVRLADETVVFSTNSLSEDPGTLNYGVAVSGTRVYLTTVHARNDLNSQFGNRPVVNRVVVFDLDPSTGHLQLDSAGIRDLDAPFLDETGAGEAQAATPYAVAVEGDRLLITAAGSDRLVVADLDGNIVDTIPVGFGPKGVVAHDDTAWVYNHTGLGVSRADLDASTSTEVVGVGPSPVPESVRIGARLFNSAQFAANKTFACASCHPDGHMDGLVWKLNEQDGLRATMTAQQIAETAPYHWDGSICNLFELVRGSVEELFGTPAPSDCETKVMVDYMRDLVRPRSPFRPVDDSVSAEAALGSAILHRSRFLDPSLDPRMCNNRLQDMTVEGKILEATGDPGNELFMFREGCGTSSCHAAPNMGGGEDNGIQSSFEAVSLLGLWDRTVTLHDSRTTRARLLEAVEVNRAYHGASPIREGDHVTGEAATLALQSVRFRHLEYNFDDDLSTHGFTVSDAAGRFMLEEQLMQSGAVGLTVVLRHGANDDSDLLDLLESSADQGKIVLVGVGLLGGELISLSWEPSDGAYLTDEGVSLTRAELLNALTSGDSMMLSGKLLPDQELAPRPKLKTLRRNIAPYLCSEGYFEYPAAVEVGETDARIRFMGIDVVGGSRVLVDGQVTGSSLNGPGPVFYWSLPTAPANPTILMIQVLSPTGMLSNTLPLPVVEPVVPPAVVEAVVARRAQQADVVLSWESQFGVTGPGTQYDVHRGRLSDLRTDGFHRGDCRSNDPDATVPEFRDSQHPMSGQGYYYLVRAENQAGISSWGTPERDADIDTCSPRFP